ncbi:MAG: PorT family protein [Bacteroidales bacterium]|nr:PorT family protein [Bacteroidales bacterium]
MLKKIINKILILGLLLIFGGVNGQFIDNFGLRAGIGLSNQYWEYKYVGFETFSGWKEYNLGPVIYINAEKEILKYLSIRTELGYNQKGFVDEINFVNEMIEGDIILHNLSFNVSGKVNPFNTKLKPYLILGLRVDYLISYKDFIVQYNGETQTIWGGEIDDYNKFVLNGLIGLGLAYNELIYIDLEFNPAITKNLDNQGLSIKDKYFAFTIGLNINNLIAKNE